MGEIGKLDVKVNDIPNELEKYMAFTINNNLIFIGSMRFIDSSLDALVKNLSDNDFKYLSQQLGFVRISKTKRSVSIYIYGKCSKVF